MDQKIPEASETTTIECEYTADGKDAAKLLKVTPAPGVYHYQVYLPKGYNTSQDTRYPCIFIASPGGNAPFHENLRDHVIASKWIAIMLVESQNGPWEPVLANFLAAHDDAVKRFRIQEGLKYATGFSGGARASSFFVTLRPGFVGLILQGAGWGWTDAGGYIYSIPADLSFAVYAIFGDQDQNAKEIADLTAKIPKRIPFKHETFKGDHSWSPKESMDRAFAWLEEARINELPYNPDLQPMYAAQFTARLAAMEGMAADFTKYEAMDALIAYAVRCKLDALESTKAAVAKLKADLKTMGNVEPIKTELKAQKAYQSLQTQEEKFRKELRDAKLKQALSSLAGQYQKLAKSYKDTRYGTKAGERAEELKKELGV